MLIEPDAQADIQAAFVFYEEKRPGLGERFRASVRAATLTIREYPVGLPEVEPGVRGMLISGFPFKLYYLAEESPLRVIAVIHTSRNPGAWKERLR